MATRPRITTFRRFDEEKRTARAGQQAPCGWLEDRFGASRQVVPSAAARPLADRDPESSKRVLSQTKKIDGAALERADAGR